MILFSSRAFAIIYSQSQRELQSFMRFKIVIDNQTRIFDCKEPLTLEALTSYVNKFFPHFSSFSFYYMDEDGDQIILQTKEDINVYLEISEKKPKIYVKKNQSETEVFDVSQIEKKVQVSEDRQETEKKQEVKKPLPKIEEKVFEQEVKVRKEIVKVEQIKEEKKSIIIHKVKCDSCGLQPIYGIRFKCSVCPCLDLCQECHDKKIHNNHPFVKIRDPNSAPVSVQVEFKASEDEKKERAEKQRLSRMIMNKVQHKEVQLKYDSRMERQLVIISLLENMFGSEQEMYYKEFARQTNENTEQKVCQSFLHWLALKKQNSEFSILSWLKKTLQKLSEKVGNTISFNAD